MSLNVPKIGRPDRPNMPKIGSRSANTSQDEPRIQPIARQTYPKIQENISIRKSKTGNPTRKLNSNADNAKKPHNNISKTQISTVFSRFSRYLRTSRPGHKIHRLDQTWAHVGPIFGLWADLPAILGTRSWPISGAMLGYLDVILDRSNGYISHTILFSRISRISKKPQKTCVLEQ